MRRRLTNLLLFISLAACIACGDGGKAITFHFIDRAPDSKNQELTIKDTESKRRIFPEAVMDGATITMIERTKEPLGQRYAVKINFNEAGTKKLKEITENKRGEILAVVADGQILAAAELPHRIDSGAFVIDAQYSEPEVNAIIDQLNGHL